MTKSAPPRTYLTFYDCRWREEIDRVYVLRQSRDGRWLALNRAWSPYGQGLTGMRVNVDTCSGYRLFLSEKHLRQLDPLYRPGLKIVHLYVDDTAPDRGEEYAKAYAKKVALLGIDDEEAQSA